MRVIDSSSRSITNSSLEHEINVLLVEGDKRWRSSTTNLLQMYSYKVTKVETAVAALSLLSERKKEIDLVLVDINVQDMEAFALVKLLAKMDLLTMLMSENDDDATISKALKSGAFLLVRRPITIDVVKQMRQHVIREKMHRVNKYDDGRAVIDVEINGASENRNELKRKVGITINQEGKKRKAKIGVAKKAKKGRKPTKNQESNSLSSVKNSVRNGSIKRRTSTEWTEELHEKFMDAVNQLGEGRCYPKEIHEMMNVPGLTRMQVASHLQKCRNDNWQTPVMRKYRYPTSEQGSNEGSQPRDNHKRFGLMPRIDQIEPNQQNRRARNRFGSYPLMTKGKEPATLSNGTQTINNTGSDQLEANYIANETIYAPTTEQTSENHTTYNPINLDLPVTVIPEREFRSATNEQRSGNHTYNPINLDLPRTVIPGEEFRSIIIEQTSENKTYDPMNLDQQLPNDDFVEFLLGSMNDYVPDLSAVLQEGTLVSQGSTTQPLINGHSLTDKATMTNQDIGGQWSANPSNFFGN